MNNSPENRERDALPPEAVPQTPLPPPTRPRVESALGAPVAPVKWTLPAPAPRPTPPLRPPPPSRRLPAAVAPPPLELPAELADFPGADAAATARALQIEREAKAKAGRSWLSMSWRDSLRDYRGTARRLATGWRRWRATAAFQVLLAFGLIYGLLAVVRKPSEVVVERSRRADDGVFLQSFLKKYCAAGGRVFGVRPHGGTELFPRGVVLQKEMLAAFARAPVGEVFVVKTNGTAWNPLQGFYGYPPIFAGGTYFELERKFNFALYEWTFLIRKDSEQAGTMLVAGVAVAR